MPTSSSIPGYEDIRPVAPALEKYAHGALADLWKRPDLNPRDRSIVTLAALIARNQTIEMSYYLNLALDNRVEPSEISEIITHLAFYSGWANAMSAVAAAKEVFAGRQIGADQLSAASGPLLPLDEAAEADRAARVGRQFGAAFPRMTSGASATNSAGPSDHLPGTKRGSRRNAPVVRDRASASVAEDSAGKLAAGPAPIERRVEPRRRRDAHEVSPLPDRAGGHSGRVL